MALLVVAGSGGHTTEIVRLVGSLSQSYNPGHYVMADTDKMSEEKIRTSEAEQEKSGSPSQYTIHRIPCSREVRQSWSSSVLSSLSALMSSVPLVFRFRPDMVLCNGPGTCFPLCAAGLLLGVLGLKRVFYYFSDYFFVQWASLKDKYPKAIYLGRLV